MYAVIETGGKQYRVEVGTELEVEKLDVEPGASVTIDRVLLVADGDEASVGQPVVANASVEAEVLRRDRGEKLIVFKYRPKARRRVKKGHRQEHTILRITDVKLNGKSAAESARKADQDAKTERQRLEEAAARQAAADAELAAKLAKQADAPKASKAGKASKASAGAEKPSAGSEKASAKSEKASAKSEKASAESEKASAESGAADTEQASPKRSRAKAAQPASAEAAGDEAEAAAESDADESTEQTAEAPKRSRTKKDE